MVTEEDLQKTNISFTYKISPVKNIICDLSAMIGEFCEELIGSFYPRNISKKSNVVITELINNAIENINDEESDIGLSVKISENLLFISVMNVADHDQYQVVKSHIDTINSSKNVRKLLRETIRERRNERLKGGLGLIRLVAENKFRLSAGYKEPYLIVRSQFSLGGSN